MNKQAIKEELARLSLVRGVRKLPDNIDFELNNGKLAIMMTDKGLTSNMQDDCAAFEGWAIMLKFWLKEKIDSIVIVFNPLDIQDLKPAESQHYQRFLYRLNKFITTYKWAHYKSDYPIDEYSTRGFVLNTPGSISDVPEAAHKEAQNERKIVEIKPDYLCITDHQLPVGVFEGKVDGTKQIMNSGAIDLWGIDKDVLNIYELKIEKNKRVGIITELFFYVNIMNDLMKHRIHYVEKDYEDIRSFKVLYEAYKNKSINKINGIFLTPSLHPLFFGGYDRTYLDQATVLMKLLDFINDSERLHSEHIKFAYQYQKELC